MTTLGGTTFVYNAIKLDYNIVETIKCLQECCDKVVAVVINSDDGTVEMVKQLQDAKTKIVVRDKTEWDLIQGRGKLAYFQNVAASYLDTDYNLLIQADEILHEDSYKWVRRAIETGEEGFLVRRIHLWGNPNTQIEVEPSRMPAGFNIIRLAKTQYESYDDGENIYVPSPNSEFLENIRIYHMGFVRERRKMVDKCNYIQKEVFQIEPDAKLNGMQIFEPEKWFAPEDLIPIKEPLPKLIQYWAKERTYE